MSDSINYSTSKHLAPSANDFFYSTCGCRLSAYLNVLDILHSIFPCMFTIIYYFWALIQLYILSTLPTQTHCDGLLQKSSSNNIVEITNIQL